MTMSALRDTRRSDEDEFYVRGLLALIRSIIRNSVENADDIEEFAGRINGRLAAITRVHTSAMFSPLRSVSLETVVHEELLAFAFHEGDRIVVSVGPIALTVRWASAMALALHELIANSISSGALRDGAGEVRIFASQDDTSIRFEWLETSPGVRDWASGLDHFGREYLEYGLGYDLKATTSFEVIGDRLSFNVEAVQGVAQT